jgi:hypothetical protein
MIIDDLGIRPLRHDDPIEVCAPSGAVQTSSGAETRSCSASKGASAVTRASGGRGGTSSRAARGLLLLEHVAQTLRDPGHVREPLGRGRGSTCREGMIDAAIEPSGERDVLVTFLRRVGQGAGLRLSALAGGHSRHGSGLAGWSTSGDPASMAQSEDHDHLYPARRRLPPPRLSAGSPRSTRRTQKG